jgi:hypothetical protein
MSQLIRSGPGRTGGTRATALASLILLIAVISALGAAGAPAQPGDGPRENVDQRFTTTRPGTPTGLRFTASYHAAGESDGPPPVMKRMVVYPPPGLRYDTSVPARCTASDAALQLLGPDACPPGSQLGTGTVEGLLLVPFAHNVVFDHFKHDTYLMNGVNEQIVLIKSEGFSVVRGKIRRDGAMVWNLPACFPRPPGGECADDHILQLKTTSRIAPYTKTSGGRVRSYAITPSTCPQRGYWRTTVRYWWANGSVDRVPTRQPCGSTATSR